MVCEEPLRVSWIYRLRRHIVFSETFRGIITQNFIKVTRVEYQMSAIFNCLKIRLTIFETEKKLMYISNTTLDYYFALLARKILSKYV